MSLSDYWYVLCRGTELCERPLARSLFGQPLVLFRGAHARPVALLDRCPHRNVPLSLGSVVGDTLSCRYHGWRFDADGACVQVPGRVGCVLPTARVPRFATLEQDGYVWAWGRPDSEPTEAPYRLDALGPEHTVLHASADYAADLHASLENTVDVPHTVFLHRGLFRAAGKQREVTCTIARAGRELSARYAGEARPETWFARLLAPGGGLLQHEDRIVAPSIVRVEYQLGVRAHLLSTVFLTPMTAQCTRLHVQIGYRLGVPGGWLKPILERVAARVLAEDASILAAQTANQRRLGGLRHASTELDTFSSSIQRLLAQAEAGPIPDEQSERRITLMM
jgi:phenylpropionate dioxygenase-like ring-hydroxylating dioxygenase large terminal subunit